MYNLIMYYLFRSLMHSAIFVIKETSVFTITLLLI
jgi:hypothetical protein